MDDTFELQPTGKIRMVFGDQEYNIRLPKLGEFKKLRVQLEEFRDSVNDARTFNAARGDEEGFVARPEPDQVDGVIAWWRSVATMLGDKPLPESIDDLPVWFLGEDILKDTLEHWRTVPLVRGPR